MKYSGGDMNPFKRDYLEDLQGVAYSAATFLVSVGSKIRDGGSAFLKGAAYVIENHPRKGVFGMAAVAVVALGLGLSGDFQKNNRYAGSRSRSSSPRVSLNDPFRAAIIEAEKDAQKKVNTELSRRVSLYNEPLFIHSQPDGVSVLKGGQSSQESLSGLYDRIQSESPLYGEKTAVDPFTPKSKRKPIRFRELRRDWSAGIMFKFDDNGYRGMDVQGDPIDWLIATDVLTDTLEEKTATSTLDAKLDDDK